MLGQLLTTTFIICQMSPAEVDKLSTVDLDMPAVQVMEQTRDHLLMDIRQELHTTYSQKELGDMGGEAALRRLLNIQMLAGLETEKAIKALGGHVQASDELIEHLPDFEDSLKPLLGHPGK
jgi:hypothetical protein